MDRDIVNRVFDAMELPPRAEAALEVEYVPDTYELPQVTPLVELESSKDSDGVLLQLSMFASALEVQRRNVEETEAQCLGISPAQAKAKLSTFIDHIFYYIGCKSEKEFLISDTKNIVLCFEGSVLSVAGQALAQALATGCAVVLLAYEKFSSTAKLLATVWTSTGLPAGRLQVKTEFPSSLMSAQPALKIFVGGHLVDGLNYSAFQPYFMNGFTTPLIVLDGADIESVVSIVSDKDHLLRHVEPWAFSVVIIQESQLPKFKQLLLERCNHNPKPTPQVQERQTQHIKRYHLEHTTAEIYHLASYRYVVFGSQPSRDNRLWPHDLNGSPLFVLPVRSAQEAVAKANHYGSGYAAAVYTQDGSVSQWVSEKLKASTVWINTVGLLHPASPLPFQVVSTHPRGYCQINAYHATANFQNLLQHGISLNLTEDEELADAPIPERLSAEVEEKVRAAVAAQPGWQAMGGLARSRIFSKLFSLMTERSAACAEKLRRVFAFYNRTSVAAESSYSNHESGAAVTSYLEPCGVIGIYVNSLKSEAPKRRRISIGGTERALVNFADSDLMAVIQGAIAYGNTCVVVLADDHDYPQVETVYGAASCLPSGVVNIVSSKNPAHWTSLVKNMDVNCLWQTGLSLTKEHTLLKGIEAKYPKRVWIGVNKYDESGFRPDLKYFEPRATTRKTVWRKTQAN